MCRFQRFLQLYIAICILVFVYFTIVLMFFPFFISGATVSAVFQPRHTCCKQFVLHVGCVSYVSWQINDDEYSYFIICA